MNQCLADMNAGDIKTVCKATDKPSHKTIVNHSSMKGKYRIFGYGSLPFSFFCFVYDRYGVRFIYLELHALVYIIDFHMATFQNKSRIEIFGEFLQEDFRSV